MRRSSRGASSPRRTARRRGRSSAARVRGRSGGHYMMAVVRRLLASLALVAMATASADAAPAAPALRVKLLDGRTFDSRDALGKKVVVLRFQASYCKPCVRESAALSK